MAAFPVEPVTVPLAHAGHWLAGLLYLAPVIVLAVAVGLQRWKDRRGGSGGVNGRGE